MTVVERLEAAIAKLERLKADSPGRLYTSNELLVTLHRTIDAQIGLLRFGVLRLRAVEKLIGKHLEAHEHEMALADAILGDNS